MSSHYMKLFTLVKNFFKKSCFCIILPYNFLFKTAPLCLFLFIFLSCIDKIKLLASIRKKLALGEHRSPIWKTIIDSTQTFLTYIIITLIICKYLEIKPRIKKTISHWARFPILV